LDSVTVIYFHFSFIGQIFGIAESDIGKVSLGIQLDAYLVPNQLRCGTEILKNWQRRKN